MAGCPGLTARASHAERAPEDSAHAKAGREESKVLADTKLKIAVFIDFDNIEIGVKSTLGGQFDIGVVLEALKERGEVVSKIAYGDWTRAGDYSRSLTQHATKLVQRNLTPGGDKNGADINLALDALEMAFTHGHINAYVIVGGDSDFITLVEKLKQYDKQVFVVGGRSFTSLVMQRNCHEFIAYENLVGSRRGADKRHSGPVTQAPIEQVLPLVRRALKVLSDREVSPQLGLLKSTLLQLDSTFSERSYGAGSFRDFAQKLASAGHVVLREHGRNVLVELAEGNGHTPAEEPSRPERQERQERPERRAHDRVEQAPRDEAPAQGQEPRAADGLREIRRLFLAAQNPPRWPMYIRQAKQFMRAVDPTFDERRFGFGSLVDLLRAAGREGLFRIERDRQGVIRLFPGNIMQPVSADRPAAAVAPDDDNRGNVADAPPPMSEPDADWAAASAPAADAGDGDAAEVVDGAIVQEMDVAPVIDGEEAPAEPEPPRRSRSRRPRGQGEPRAPRKAAEPSGPRPRKTAAKRTPRARKPAE
jgi:uncharacterized LabA/DUF88 family protein